MITMEFHTYAHARIMVPAIVICILLIGFWIFENLTILITTHLVSFIGITLFAAMESETVADKLARIGIPNQLDSRVVLVNDLIYINHGNKQVCKRLPWKQRNLFVINRVVVVEKKLHEKINCSYLFFLVLYLFFP